MGGQSANRRRDTAAFLVAAMLLLLVPAFANGFPLIFPDSSVYLDVAFRHAWTIDRSGFYGFYLIPAAWFPVATWGLWVMIAIQAFAIGVILHLAFRRLIPESSLPLRIGLVALLVVTTSLPWHASQLMPDAFTGALVLLVWVAAMRDAGEPGTPLLWLAVCALVLLHLTHFVVALAALLGTLTGCNLIGARLRPMAKTLALGMVALALAVGAQTTAYGLTIHRWSPAPTGPWFLFARLHEDGLIDPWLARHCGHDAPAELCEIAPKLPRDSQVLLWQEGTPLNSSVVGRMTDSERWHWMGMLQQANMGSIAESPGRFMMNSLRAGARQFAAFAVLDDECPQICAGEAILDRFEKDSPGLASQLSETPQVRGEIPKAPIRAVTSAIALLGLIALIPLMFVAYRRRDREALGLLGAIIAALVGNAVVTGALSDVHDRYQSRVVWLAVFAAMVLPARWWRDSRARRPNRAAKLL